MLEDNERQLRLKQAQLAAQQRAATEQAPQEEETEHERVQSTRPAKAEQSEMQGRDAKEGAQVAMRHTQELSIDVQREIAAERARQQQLRLHELQVLGLDPRP